jgi:hypothetical protein
MYYNMLFFKSALQALSLSIAEQGRHPIPLLS